MICAGIPVLPLVGFQNSLLDLPYELIVVLLQHVFTRGIPSPGKAPDHLDVQAVGIVHHVLCIQGRHVVPDDDLVQPQSCHIFKKAPVIVDHVSPGPDRSAANSGGGRDLPWEQCFVQSLVEGLVCPDVFATVDHVTQVFVAKIHTAV